MWLSLSVLIVTLVPMVFLNRWLSRHIQGVGLLLTGHHNVAIILYFALMLPGIIVHELSHWLMARLLGLRTGKLSLGPTKAAGGKVQLGAVRIARADPLRESLVGLAPLLAGSALILLIGTMVFDLGALTQAFVLRDAGWFFQLLGRSLKTPDFWLWLYLIFAISNAMLPSETDRRAWLPLGIFLAGVTALLLFAGWVPRLSPAAMDSVIGFVDYLGTAFLITLAIDLLFMGIIAGLEWGLSHILGRRIQY